MNTKVVLIGTIALIVAAAGVLWWRDYGRSIGEMGTSTATTTAEENIIEDGTPFESFTVGGEEWRRYTDNELMFGFSFRKEPNGYTYAYVEEDAENNELYRADLYNSQELQQFPSGNVPGELPPAITVAVYEQGDYQNAQEWAESEHVSNFALGPKQIENAAMGEHDAISYFWSGLYEGRTTAVAHEGYIYVVSVQYLSVDDPIVADSNAVVESFELLHGDTGEAGHASGQSEENDETPINWSGAQQMIKDCNVTLVLQTHDQKVHLTLRDGTRVVATEPTIDEVMAVVQEAESKCGMIPVATE